METQNEKMPSTITPKATELLGDLSGLGIELSEVTPYQHPAVKPQADNLAEQLR